MQSASHEERSTERLPLAALLALAMTGFVCIVTETLPAGLLPNIAQAMQISQAAAGQWVTAYALGSVLAAIPLLIATRRWPRRRVLLLTLLGFFVFNSITAFSMHYAMTLLARFGAGMAAGLAWSLLAGYARRLVAPHLQGKALAIAMAGTPIALALGVPLGTWLGSFIGWRAVFGLMSLLAMLLMLWVLKTVPDYPGQTARTRLGVGTVLQRAGVPAVLAVVLTWMLAHNMLYTYIGPFVAQAGLATRIDMVLLVFGIAALAGIWLAGQWVDQHLRVTVLGSLAAFAATALVFGLDASMPWIIYLGVGVWGLTFGGAATLLQTALADAAGPDADVALALNVVVWNSAIAGGGILGGLLLQARGANALPLALLVLLGLAWWLVWTARRAGFPPGPRRWQQQ